jgi:putative hydrolase of the HAD superfamily
MVRAMPPAATPDFRHVETWIFDLDNTLYPASCDLFAQIDARMTEFVSRYFACGNDEARSIQKAYYRDHGTTLTGMMKMHGMEPGPYLEFVHDIDLSVVPHDPALDEGLARLPGRKLIFTNGSVAHAERVMNRLGITAHFSEVIDIAATSYVPKPDRRAFETLTKRCAIETEGAAMFEDIARNLVIPAELGMTTVWVRNDSAWSKQGPEWPQPSQEHIHHEAQDLGSFLLGLRVKERP